MKGVLPCTNWSNTGLVIRAEKWARKAHLHLWGSTEEEEDSEVTPTAEADFRIRWQNLLL
jgi:hypothetical protein